MASIQTNVSKGREVELYNRVLTNDPASSALTLIVLASGSPGVNGLADFDTVAAILAGGYTEVTNTNYARENYTDADLSAWAPDDTNNRVLLTLPMWSSLNIAAGDVWDLAVVAYTPNTGTSTDTNRIPITASELRENGTALVPAASTMIVDFSGVWITAT